jgi:predicted aminopeptidase
MYRPASLLACLPTLLVSLALSLASLAPFLAGLPLLGGCQAGYVLNQGVGQLSVGSRQVPLDSAALRETLPGDSLAKLRWVPEVLRFCRDELGLEPGDSYGTYLDTGGEPVSWIVMAAHPLALVPQSWSFPFVGVVPYKGFFQREEALGEEAELRARGLDTVVLPVAAFSTLGWFRDPVISTMLEGSVADLVDIIVHEATHRTVYFDGAGSFNESLASHVAREGTVRFLFAHAELRGLLPAYLEADRRSREREELIVRLKNDLETLYRSDLSTESKIRRKLELFDSAALVHASLFPRARSSALPASNAYVLSVGLYHEHASLLEDLEAALGSEPRSVVEYLKGLPRDRDPLERVGQRILGERS